MLCPELGGSGFSSRSDDLNRLRNLREELRQLIAAMDRPSFSFATASLSLEIIASAALFDIPSVQSAVTQGQECAYHDA